MHALVLHNMGARSSWREAVADLEFALPRYGRGVRALVHDAALPLPRYLREFPWDLVVLNSTVMGAVTGVASLARLRERLAFLADSPAFKVALPQDDYYCSEELDGLVTALGMDAVYTVCPEHWQVLYPRYLAAGGKVTLGFTGYVTPRMRDLCGITRPRAQRRNDVVYRATGRPGFPNELAQVKAQLGTHFLERFDGRWQTDISTDDRRVITGAAWWRFLADSRTTLGSNSGSSVLIRNHEVMRCIAEYRAENPAAPYSEIVAACIPERDRIEFTAISPRIMEAALVETTQLLVPGTYSGVIRAGEHYQALAEDCSNTTEITALMQDHALQSRLAGACKEAVLGTPAIQIETFLDDLVARTARHHQSPHAPSAGFSRLRARHRIEAPARERAHYARERMRRATPAWLLRAYLRFRGVAN